MKTIKIDNIEYNLVPVDPPFEPNVGEKIEVILSNGARREFRILDYSYDYPRMGHKEHFTMHINDRN